MKEGKFKAEKSVILRTGGIGQVISAVYYDLKQEDTALSFPSSS